MQEVIVKQGQTIFDVAVEYLDNALMAYQIAMLNGISVTDVLQYGSTIKIPNYTNTYTSEKSVNQTSEVYVVTVKQGQSLLDIAVQYCGDAAAAFDIAKINNLTFSSSLEAGTSINLIPSLNEGLSKYFKNGNHTPATAANLKTQIIEPILSGIDYWAIETDFIVS